MGALAGLLRVSVRNRKPLRLSLFGYRSEQSCVQAGVETGPGIVLGDYRREVISQTHHQEDENEICVDRIRHVDDLVHGKRG